MVGLEIVCLFLAFPMYSVSRTVFEALIGLSGFLLLGCVVIAIKGVQERYSLSALRDLHEESEILKREREIELEFDSIYCLGCGEAYDTRLPACPRCRCPRGQGPCC